LTGLKSECGSVIGPRLDTSSGRGPGVVVPPQKCANSLSVSLHSRTGVRVGFNQRCEQKHGSSDDCRTDSLGYGQRVDRGHLAGPAVRQETAHGTAARAGAGEKHQEEQVEDGQEWLPSVAFK